VPLLRLKGGGREPKSGRTLFVGTANCFRSNLKGMDAVCRRSRASVNRFPRFLRSKNLKAKNGMDAVFRQRKG
jgi:hypothetical protein